MIEQFYERLFPEMPTPKLLTADEQRQVVRAARRLQRAVRQYLYDHGSYGTVGTPGGDPALADSAKHAKTCATCRELQAALDEG